MFSLAELFCLACGEQIAGPLQRAASLRCHDCREAGQPISFELALRARALALRLPATHEFPGHDDPAPQRAAA
jgi:hypothetical protein